MDATQALETTTQLAAPTETASNMIYLMGLSFILGVLFTIFLLALLDFMKRDRVKRDPIAMDLNNFFVCR